MMKLSVVTTLYNSERYVSVLLRKLIDIIVTDLKLDNTDFEIIMVDDGSSDSSLKVALDEKQKYKDVNIKIIQLSKNFGHHNALMAGLSVAKGNYVYITDADLEVHPKYMKYFYDLILESNADVVYGIAKEREGGFIRKYLGGIFWKVFNFFSDTNVPESMANERLMSRKYVDALLQIKENNFFIG
ncbi:MAG: glycosyltransferase, partial [Bacteroidetes bacterium]